MKRERLARWLIIPAIGCMIGALSLPLLHSSLSVELPSWVPPGFRVRFQEWVVEAGHLPVGDYSIWRIVGYLFAHRQYVVGSVIVLFAVILPVVDLLLCALLTLPGAAAVSVLRRRRLFRVLGSTTRGR